MVFITGQSGPSEAENFGERKRTHNRAECICRYASAHCSGTVEFPFMDIVFHVNDGGQQEYDNITHLSRNVGISHNREGAAFFVIWILGAHVLIVRKTPRPLILGAWAQDVRWMWRSLWFGSLARVH